MTGPLLKFVAEFCFNKSQRLTFDSSSPNGILLFREVGEGAGGGVRGPAVGLWGSGAGMRGSGVGCGGQGRVCRVGVGPEGLAGWWADPDDSS